MHLLVPFAGFQLCNTQTSCTLNPTASCDRTLSCRYALCMVILCILMWRCHISLFRKDLHLSAMTNKILGDLRLDQVWNTLLHVTCSHSCPAEQCPPFVRSFLLEPIDFIFKNKIPRRLRTALISISQPTQDCNRPFVLFWTKNCFLVENQNAAVGPDLHPCSLWRFTTEDETTPANSVDSLTTIHDC